MRTIFLISLILASSGNFPFAESAQVHNRTLYTEINNLLAKYVTNDGRVNYRRLKSENSMKKIIDSFKTVRLNSFSSLEKKAFLINLYNISCIHLVLQHYPEIQKVIKISGFFTKKSVNIGGKMYSLNQIEKELLIKVYKDARLHFVLNCAARSCPPLLNQVYLPQILDKQLHRQTIEFISDAKNGTAVNHRTKTIYLSQIFNWYENDFGNVKKFILQYRNDLVKIINEYSLSYLEYNWELNSL